MDYPQQHIKPYDKEGKKTEQVERMFDNIAHAYDKLNHTLSLGIDRSWRRKAIAWLRPFHPQRMMDVATGTGDFAILACRELQPAELIGTDISEGMMNVGREKVKKEGLSDKISFAREDCTSLSFADNGFDAITVAYPQLRRPRQRSLRDVPCTETGRSSCDSGANHSGALSDEATILHLLKNRHSVTGQTSLQRQQRLPLFAGHHQSISARGNNERSSFKSRIR